MELITTLMFIYGLSFNTPSGEKIELKDFEEKVLLIVNTATKCGLSNQLKELETLHQKYKNQGLVIIGFPCNQFMGQEPETNETMVQVCKKNFGVTFQLSEKVEVNGKNTHEVFKYLKKELNGTMGNAIKWNFTKFLIDKTGKPQKRYAPIVNPKDIENEIIRLLAE